MSIKYPFRENSSADIFCKISKVDWKTGYSDAVSVDKLKEYGFQFGNGGSWCRSDGSLGKQFNINRMKHKGRIIAVKLEGFNKDNRSSNISLDIRKIFKSEKCRVLYIGGNFIEIDHKDGRKDDLLVEINQNENDFQTLHKTVNVAKRDHCKKCVSTDVRFYATALGYSEPQWIGPKEYIGSCVGCYWYDPYVFNKKMSENFLKIR